jgi:hypothetical protein
MAELVSEMDRAAAAYWMRIARAGGADAGAAISTAQRLIVEARAESRLADRAHRLTLDDIEAPPLRMR